MDNMKIALALMKLSSHSLVCLMFKKNLGVLLFSFSKFWKVGVSYELPSDGKTHNKIVL
jgi:hypothetical protein